MNAFLYNGGTEFRNSSVPVPEPRADNIIAEVLLCSICGTDIRTYKNGSERISPPRVIGHEICARITHIGDEASAVGDGLKTGDKILVVPAIGCGKCYSCRRGYTNLCESLETIGFQYDGGFAEYIEIPLKAVKRGNVLKVPEHMKPEQVVLCEPTACTLNGQEMLNISDGDTVAIFGAGFIGCMHAELARLKGASRIIVVEFPGTRAEQAKKMIPDVNLINPGTDDVVSEIKRYTGSIGADVLITACSVGDTHRQALEAAAPRGRISLFGGLPDNATGFLDSNIIHYKELGVFGVHASTVKQNRQILDWVIESRLDTEKYISRIYPLEDINSAFAAVTNEALLKAVIKP